MYSLRFWHVCLYKVGAEKKIMDKIIKKKRFNTKRITLIVMSVFILSLIIFSLVNTAGGSKLNVQKERLTIAEVKEGVFREYIPVNGVVLPISSIYLDALEGGRVEEIMVEDGAVLKKGEPILRLSNTDLQLSLVNQETQVYNLITQMQIAKNAAQQNTIVNLNQMTDVENTLKEAERVYLLNQKLYASKAIGRQEYEQSKNNYEYQLAKKKLALQTIEQDSQSATQQLKQAEQSFSGSQHALQVMRKKVNDLIVRAPIDGQLTSLDAEVGQNKTKGELLGQIDVLEGIKIRADIDEHYISRIYVGLRGNANISGKTYDLEIKKVYTQVTGGRFQVDLEFLGEKPTGVRRGQTVQIRLALSDETNGILIPRGGFYNQTGGSWIFKLSEDESRAFKVDIQLGRQNPDFYEVIQGLKPGEKVIINSYDNYEKIDELNIKP